jgi:hypothetical protein
MLSALDMMTALEPSNATESLLAVQMVGVHYAATQFLANAMGKGQPVDGPDANLLRATRLMRLFNEQLEAMRKLRGKTGQQKVVVEHVHVHSGAQAVVGAVVESNRTPARKDGRGDKNV